MLKFKRKFRRQKVKSILQTILSILTMRFFVWSIVTYLKYIISCNCVFILYSCDFALPAPRVLCSGRYAIVRFPISRYMLHSCHSRTYPIAYKLMVLIVTCFRGSISMETRETRNQNLRILVTGRFLLKIVFIEVETGYKIWLKFLMFIKFYLVPPPVTANKLGCFASLYHVWRVRCSCFVCVSLLVKNSVSSKDSSCTLVLINP